MRAFLTLGMVSLSTLAEAYVGPGLGLGALGALLGGLLAVLLGLAGVLWYPLKRLFRRRQRLEPVEPTIDADASDETHPDTEP